MPQVFNNNIGMLEIHRSTIQRNHQALVETCNIDLLLPKLLEKNVFSSEMAKKYQNGKDRDRKDKLFKGILKRGPKAFDNLLNALYETKQFQPYDLLKNNHCEENRALPRSHAHPFQLPIHEEGITHNTEQIRYLGSIFCNVNIQTEPLKVQVKKSNQFYDAIGEVPVYQTSSKHRGAVLIINMKTFVNNIEPTRQASEIDVQNLKELFNQMHMHVEIHCDKSKKETVNIINTFANNPILKIVDMMFVFVMSHGDKGDHDTHVVCSDGNKLDTSWIEKQFNNTNCVLMQKKPKIFVYQLCRGKLKDMGTHKRIVTDSSLQNISIRTCEDILIAHSTLPDNESHRDIYLGSWYIQLICEIFMLHSCNTHIEDMLKIVDNKLENLRSENQTMQTSVYTNQGFKNCYIHPGIYSENGQLKYFETV